VTQQTSTTAAPRHQQRRPPAGVGRQPLPLAAAQELLPQWERLAADPGRRPALLVTGGGLALHEPPAARQAVAWGVEGIAVAKAAQHKLVACLREALAPRGVFVGQVTVRGVVRGTAWEAVRSGAEEEGGGGGGDGGEEAGGGEEKAAAAGGGGGEASSDSERQPPVVVDTVGKKDAGHPAAAAAPAAAAEEEDQSPPILYFTPDDVAGALWRLYEEQPNGDGWHVMLTEPGAAAGGVGSSGEQRHLE